MVKGKKMAPISELIVQDNEKLRFKQDFFVMLQMYSTHNEHNWFCYTEHYLNGPIRCKTWNQMMYTYLSFQGHYCKQYDFEAVDCYMLFNVGETCFGAGIVFDHRNERAGYLELKKWNQ